MTDRPGGMHRHIVAALGDEDALAAVGADGFLAPAAWGAAVERTRQRRYPALPDAEAHRRVGADVALGFLASDGGRLVAATLPELGLPRAFASVFTPMAERLRRALDFDFEPRPDGGLIRVHGPRVVPAEHIEGFFGALLARVRGQHRVTLARVTDTLVELRVERLP